MNLPAKPLANANVQRLLKPCTCRESLLDLNLKNQQRISPQSDSDAQEFRCEHPAGRSLFWIKRDKNYDWKHTPVFQFDCRNNYRTVWLIPGRRLADWVSTPNQNNERSFWMNRRTQYRSSSSSGVLCLLFSFFLVYRSVLVFSRVFVRLESVFVRNM